MAAVKKIQPLIDFLAKLKKEHDDDWKRYKAASKEGEYLMLMAVENIINKLEKIIDEADTPRKPKGGAAEE